MAYSYSQKDKDDFEALARRVEARAQARTNAVLADLGQEFEYPPFYADGLNDPDFDRVDPVHNWRNYVPDAYKRRWGELPYETKVAVYVMAEIQAHREEWD
jgi:hypothetical protein